MGKAELGEKQVCPNCGAKFYDLTRRPAVCPKCSHAFDPADEIVKLKRAKTTRAPVYETEEDEETEDKRVEKSEDGFEDEAEETVEIDADAADEPADLVEDEDEEGATRAAGADALPPGFSETDDAELDETSAEDDDGVPLLEEDEEFQDEELGDVAEGEDEDSR